MQRNVFCPSCNRGLFAGDAFCSWCGTPLGEVTQVSGARRKTYATETIAPVQRRSCTSCNSPILHGDTFCAACGARYGEVDVEPSSGYDSAIPSQLVKANRGKYEILSELGRGGMGYVYLARDLELNRLDAIKVLKPSMLAEEGMIERFRGEARTIANLRHPSIVSVYGVGKAENLYYFVMDYIDGTSLSRILKTVDRLSIPVVEAILYQVGSALSYAHRSVVHRDVKPANIMLNREGRAVVTDFGIAKMTEVQAGLTRTGVLMGTPEYMSPEQCRESSVTHHTDQYALGAVAFAMLSGAPPFTGQWMQVAAAHQSKSIPPLRELRPDCPEPLVEAIERMLAKYPGERWPDINDALKFLSLRPMAHDDPVREEISELVEETMRIDAERRAATTPDASVQSRTPTDLRIVPPPDEIELGDVVPLHASMVFSDGLERDGEGLSWQSTDPSIARISERGELEAVGVGSVQITARHGDVSSSLAVGVVPPRVVDLTIHPQNLELGPGDSVQMRAAARNKRGEQMGRQVSWSTSNPRLVRIAENGLLTAHEPGTASLMASCDGAGAATSVVVRAGAEAVDGSTPATGWTVRSGAGVASDGRTTDPSARTNRLERERRGDTPPPAPPPGPAPGNAREPAPAASTPAARPAASGGTARRRWGFVAIPAFVVLAVAGWWFTGRGGPPPASDIRITHGETGESVTDEIELLYGEPLPLVATVTDANGEPLERPVEWRTEDPAIASVTGAGIVRPVSGGVTGLLVSVDLLTERIALRVAVPVEAVSIVDVRGSEVEQLSLDVGETVDLGAAVLGSDGNGLTDRSVTWRSRDPNTVSIDGDGYLTALRPGATFVDAMADGVSGSLAVSVLTEEMPTPPQPIDLEIVITVAPWANLFVDGVEMGFESNTYRIRLMPGPHQIRLEHPAFQTYRETIDPGALPIPPGRDRPLLRIDMVRNSQEADER